MSCSIFALRSLSAAAKPAWPKISSAKGVSNVNEIDIVRVFLTHFLKGTTLGLWDEEEDPDDTDGSHDTEEDLRHC